jgi:diguanylate cyclase (GGDEF)-like protein
VSTEFRVRSSLGVGVAGLILLTPFAVNHLQQGRIVLGLGTVVVLLALLGMASMAMRGRYAPWLAFAGLTPAVLFILVVALREQGVIGVLWCFPTVLVFYVTLPERQAWIANAALYAVAVPTAWAGLPISIAARVAATLLGVSVFSAIFVRQIGKQQRELEERAVTDPLTGLRNRALLASTLEQAMEQARRSDVSMTLLGLDLDEFKSINDVHGHDAGDAVLRGVADILRSRIRRTDEAFRLGGEEFLVFLYGTDAERGRRLAEELRSAVESREMVPGLGVTVSIGVAGLDGDADWEAWMRRCDENLYSAKAHGRNLVVG